MLVGSAQGGVAAAEIAAAAGGASFTVDQVVTAGAPSAQVPTLPERHPHAVAGGPRRPRGPARLPRLAPAPPTGWWSCSTPAASPGDGEPEPAYVLGGRAADHASNADLRAEISRIQGLGYLAG